MQTRKSFWWRRLNEAINSAEETFCVFYVWDNKDSSLNDWWFSLIDRLFRDFPHQKYAKHMMTESALSKGLNLRNLTEILTQEKYSRVECKTIDIFYINQSSLLKSHCLKYWTLNKLTNSSFLDYYIWFRIILTLGKDI